MTSRRRELLSVGWCLLPLLLAIPTGPMFAWAAWRLRSRGLAAAAVGYAVATVAFLVLSSHDSSTESDSGLGGGVAAVAILAGLVQAFVLRRRVFSLSRPAVRHHHHRPGLVGAVVISAVALTSLAFVPSGVASWHRSHVIQGGPRVDATVLAEHVSSRPTRSGTAHTTTFSVEFQTRDGATVRTTAAGSGRFDVAVGDEVAVRYDPHHVRRAEVDGHPTATLGLLLWLLGVTLALLLTAAVEIRRLRSDHVEPHLEHVGPEPG